jgi:hypothetical protein
MCAGEKGGPYPDMIVIEADYLILADRKIKKESAQKKYRVTLTEDAKPADGFVLPEPDTAYTPRLYSICD